MSEVDKKEYPKPSLTADIVVVALGERRALRVLFIQRAHDPFAGAWALPGGFVEPTETAAQGAARELREETGLTGIRMDEIACFSRPGRDPRGWVVSIAHLAPVPADRMADARAGDDAAAAAWLDLTISPAGAALEHEGVPVTALAFDHREILDEAASRLRKRADTHVFRLLPETFTLAELGRAIEAIAGGPIEEAAIREHLVDTGAVRDVGGGRFTKGTRVAPWWARVAGARIAGT